MGHKSAMSLVLSQMLPVYPSKGGQPPYYRSKHSIQISPRLKSFQSCIASALYGKKFNNRAAVRSAFTDAAKKC